MPNQVVVTVPFTDLRAEAHPTAIVSIRRYADSEVDKYRALLDEARQMSYDPDMEQGFVDRKSDYASRGLNIALRLTRTLQDTPTALAYLKATPLKFTLDGEIYEQKPVVEVPKTGLDIFWSALRAHVETIRALPSDLRINIEAHGQSYENIEQKDIKADDKKIWVELSRHHTVTVFERADYAGEAFPEGQIHLLALTEMAEVFKFYQPLRGETVLTTPRKAPDKMTLTCPHCEDKLTVTDGTLGSCPTCWNNTKVQWTDAHGWHLTSWE